MALEDRNYNTDRISFTLRLKAWWNGVNARDLLSGANVTDSSYNQVDNDNAAKCKDDAAIWSDSRLKFYNRLWGGENCEEVILPGGTDYSLSLVQPIGLDSSKTMLDLCAGQGGSVRRIAKEFQLWSEGMGTDKILADKANQLSILHGVGKKAPIKFFNPDKLILREKRYDAILMRESLYNITNKQNMIDIMFKSLKPRGHLILTDYVYKQEKSEENKAVDEWRKGFGEFPPHPWTMDNYRRAIINKNMNLHVHENRTKEYSKMILDAWVNLVQNLEKSEMTDDFIKLLINEAKYWMRINKALETGEMHYMRIHATRGGESI